MGQHFSTFYTAEEREKNSPYHSLSTARTEGRFESEGWRVRKDGTRFWASVVIDAIKDETGAIIGFAKITRDISEKKKAEQALFQSQKLEAIGQLTGGIAHDFNNLLMVIQSSMELLRKRAQNDEKMISLVDNATEGVKRGVSLTQRMLSFARRQEMDIRPLNIHELILGMTELLQRSLGPSIQIDLRFPMVLSKVSADSNQLESAVLNLAVNARDAMPDGGPLIISAHEENLQKGNSLRVAPGKYVCVAIEDRGEGMSEHTLNRAADPFFTTKGVGKGTGLGLSMVQGFAEQSGGRLRLRSQKNVGTTAEIWLPSTDVTDKPKAAEEAITTAGSRLRPLAVLAVDDDVLVRMGTTSMLEDLGHTVEEANSGEEALKILAHGNKIDLVLTDHAMPRMTGLQLAEAIHAQRPKMPIILATGYAELPTGNGEKLPRLSKPFTQQQLAQALSDALVENT